MISQIDGEVGRGFQWKQHIQPAGQDLEIVGHELVPPHRGGVEVGSEDDRQAFPLTELPEEEPELLGAGVPVTEGQRQVGGGSTEGGGSETGGVPLAGADRAAGAPRRLSRCPTKIRSGSSRRLIRASCW